MRGDRWPGPRPAGSPVAQCFRRRRASHSTARWARIKRRGSARGRRARAVGVFSSGLNRSSESWCVRTYSSASFLDCSAVKDSLLLGQRRAGSRATAGPFRTAVGMTTTTALASVSPHSYLQLSTAPAPAFTGTACNQPESSLVVSPIGMSSSRAAILGLHPGDESTPDPPVWASRSVIGGRGWEHPRPAATGGENNSAQRSTLRRYRRRRATASGIRDDAAPTGAGFARTAVAIHPSWEKCPGSAQSYGPLGSPPGVRRPIRRGRRVGLAPLF